MIGRLALIGILTAAAVVGNAQLVTWRESVIDSSDTNGLWTLGMSHGVNNTAAPFAFFTAPVTSTLEVVETALSVVDGSAMSDPFWLIVCRSPSISVLQTYVSPYELGSSGLITRYLIGPATSSRNLGVDNLGFPQVLPRFEGLGSLGITFETGESGFMAVVDDNLLYSQGGFRSSLSRLGPTNTDVRYNTGLGNVWEVSTSPIGDNFYASPVPEPSSIAGFAIAIVALLKRRRTWASGRQKPGATQ